MAIETLLTALLVPAIVSAAIPPFPGRNDTLRITGGFYAQKGGLP